MNKAVDAIGRLENLANRGSYEYTREPVSYTHLPEEITRFKQMDNAVLFAAGSCWEGVDFPGDMVSSLIIVKRCV